MRTLESGSVTVARKRCGASSSTIELSRRRCRQADTATPSNISPSSADVSMKMRTMPVIPYTLQSASLWREFPIYHTLSAHREAGYETVNTDHPGDRSADHRALLLYVHRPRDRRMPGLRGI